MNQSSPTKEEVLDFLKRYCLTAPEFAELVGVSTTTIYNAAKGISKLKPAIWARRFQRIDPEKQAPLDLLSFTSPTPDEINAWINQNKLSNIDAAKILGISRSYLANAKMGRVRLKSTSWNKRLLPNRVPRKFRSFSYLMPEGMVRIEIVGTDEQIARHVANLGLVEDKS